ncbi:MAG: dihydrofolate reductase family protein [Anaeromyxobacteraceae bacterium]
MNRPTFAVFIATSADGFIARPDGRLDWLEPFQTPGEDHGYAAFAASVDALVIGRKTYDTALAFPEWPYAGKKVVVWTRGEDAPEHGARFLSAEPAALAATLAAEGVRRVYLDGGRTISAFLAADLVDELTVSVVPRILGDGIPLFRPPLPDLALTLLEARAYPNGLVQLRWKRARP